MRWLGWGVIVFMSLWVSACSDRQPAIPGVKIGKPYQISGRWYRPNFDPSYDEIGVASWYGPGFHGNYTASGEPFDQNEMTAAHTTLPMPSRHNRRPMLRRPRVTATRAPRRNRKNCIKTCTRS